MTISELVANAERAKELEKHIQLLSAPLKKESIVYKDFNTNNDLWPKELLQLTIRVGRETVLASLQRELELLLRDPA